MNQNAQTFTIFKMLISVVFVFLILTIILSSITYFDGLRLGISKQKVSDAMKNAVRQPNGDVITISNVSVEKGYSFSSRNFSEESGIGTDCITLEAIGLSGIEASQSTIRLTNGFSGNIYIQCISSSSPGSSCTSGCQICCIFSVGKEIISIP